MIRLLVSAVLVFVVAVACVAFWRSAAPSSAGGLPGMSLRAPESVQVGEVFQVSVYADPPPAGGAAGYNTEIVLPQGLTWLQRPSCEQEAAARVGGSAPGLCARARGWENEVRHVAGSGIIPPLQAFDEPLDRLIEVDVQCTAEGTYSVHLPAADRRSAPFGAVYFGPDTLPIDVRTVPHAVDRDGDTLPEYSEVAGFTTVECGAPTATPCPPAGCLTPTPTRTLTPTRTPTPTGMPPPFPPCDWMPCFPSPVGMALSGPATVHTGELFTLTVRADPAPARGVAGYNTEVVLPSGLHWLRRPACAAELAATVDGDRPRLCARGLGPQGEARHVAGTGFVPPLPPFDEPLGDLVELDLECTVPGAYTVALTAAVAGASFGAVYFGTDLLPIDVATVPYALDLDGDTEPEFTDVTDTLSIVCTGDSVTPRTPTPTRTPTSTPSPTPCPSNGCPTPTRTPTPRPTACPVSICPIQVVPDCDNCPRTAGMAMTAPSTVETGEVFPVRLFAHPAPDGGVAGFATEVVLPPAMQWLQRPDCVDEAVPHAAGEQHPGLCTRATGPFNEVRHAVGTNVIPPLSPFDRPLYFLLEIDVVCNEPGAHELVLTAAHSAPFGGLFFATDASEILLRPREHDVDLNGDTIADLTEVAAYLPVTCTGDPVTPRPPTATPTPTPDAGGSVPPECPVIAPPSPCWPEPPWPEPTIIAAPVADGEGGKPGMSLSAPAEASTGKPFTLTVHADPPPARGVAGYQTELVLPPAMQWIQRPTCQDEAMARADGEAVAICARGAGPSGQVRHVVGPAAVVAPPLPRLDEPLDELIQVDVVCNEPGERLVRLTAASPYLESRESSPFGALYFATNAHPVFVNAEEVRPRLGAIADSIVISCVDGPPGGTAASATPVSDVSAAGVDPAATATPGTDAAAVQLPNAGDGPFAEGRTHLFLTAIGAAGLALAVLALARRRRA